MLGLFPLPASIPAPGGGICPRRSGDARNDLLLHSILSSRLSLRRVRNNLHSLGGNELQAKGEQHTAARRVLLWVIDAVHKSRTFTIRQRESEREQNEVQRIIVYVKQLTQGSNHLKSTVRSTHGSITG